MGAVRDHFRDRHGGFHGDFISRYVRFFGDCKDRDTVSVPLFGFDASDVECGGRSRIYGSSAVFAARSGAGFGELFISFDHNSPVHQIFLGQNQPVVRFFIHTLP